MSFFILYYYYYLVYSFYGFHLQVPFFNSLFHFSFPSKRFISSFLLNRSTPHPSFFKSTAEEIPEFCLLMDDSIKNKRRIYTNTPRITFKPACKERVPLGKVIHQLIFQIAVKLDLLWQ
jgi:hypothetical protein